MRFVNLQREAFKTAFLKIIGPRILFLPEPLHELVFPKNALRNTEVTMSLCPKTCGYCLPRRFLLCPLWVSQVKCKDAYSDSFPPHTWPLQCVSGKVIRTPTSP